MGGDWFGNAEQITAYSLNSGRFSFSGGASGNSLADFLLGQVVQYQRQTGGPAHLHSFEWGAFFSDDWKMTRRFTFNLGLRYFIQTPWVADWGGPNGLIPDGVATFIPGYKSKRWANIPPGVLFPADNGPNGTIPRGLYPTPYNNWEPRFGFAFDPGGDGKTSIRGSFGIFHDIIIPDVVAQAGSVQPYVYREVFNSPAGGLSNPYQGFANPWPYTAFLSSNPPFYLPATAASLDRHTTNPNVQSWSLDVQRQLLSNFLIEAAYVGKATRHLILITDGNPSVYLPGANAQGNPLSIAQNIDARRIFAPTYSVIHQVGPYGFASYQGLQLNAEYRLRYGLSFHAAYTWSHSLDTNSHYAVAGSYQEQTPFCLRCEWGNADFDLTHVFSLSWVYNVPAPFRGAQSFAGTFLRGLLGNWEASGITRLTSGFPFSCLTGGNNSLNGLFSDRCDVVGSLQFSGNRSTGAEVRAWFNQAAFTANPIGALGDTGRNVLRGPDQKGTDFALMRNFPIREPYGRFQFRAEFFNVFNQVTFNNPNNILNSPTFGQITSAASPKLIQFALKYLW